MIQYQFKKKHFDDLAQLSASAAKDFLKTERALFFSEGSN
jgi:hypothetical protein